jgi:hypothetical protein
MSRGTRVGCCRYVHRIAARVGVSDWWGQGVTGPHVRECRRQRVGKQVHQYGARGGTWSPHGLLLEFIDLIGLAASANRP